MILSPKSIPGVKFIFSAIVLPHETEQALNNSKFPRAATPGNNTTDQPAKPQNFHKQRRERDHPLLAPKLARK